MKFKFTPSLKRLLVTVSVWFFAAALVAAADWYFWIALSKKRVQLTESKSAAAVLEKKRASISRERGNIRNISAELEKIENAFVDASYPLAFIETLEELSKKRGVALELAPPRIGALTLLMRMGFEGSLQNALVFIGDVEFLPEQVIIKNLSLALSGDKDSPQAKFIGQIEFLAK